MEIRNRWWQDRKFPHLQFPKELLSARYKGLSLGAKVLYVLMFDRMKLSDMNGWVDEENNIFIRFTLDDIMRRMHISRGTANKYKKELVKAKLIRFRQKGKTDPHQIYVLPFFDTSDPEWSKKQTFTGTENVPREVQFLDPSNTKDSNTESNIYLSAIDGCYTFDNVSELIKDNIGYDVLSERKYDMDLIDCYVDIMVHAVCTSQQYISIGSDKIPADLVRSKFLKFNMSNVIYVYNCMEENTSDIRNVRAYLLKALYNAPSTMTSYYRSKVQHDMPELAGTVRKEVTA